MRSLSSTTARGARRRSPTVWLRKTKTSVFNVVVRVESCQPSFRLSLLEKIAPAREPRIIFYFLREFLQFDVGRRLVLTLYSSCENSSYILPIRIVLKIFSPRPIDFGASINYRNAEGYLFLCEIVAFSLQNPFIFCPPKRSSSEVGWNR